MNRLRTLFRMTAVAGALAFAFVTMLAHVNAGAPAQFIVLDTILGVLFIVAGAIAWQRRPETLTGPILTACGALWFAGSWAPTGIEPYAGIAFSFERYYDPLLAFLALSFPARRPVSRLGLALVLLLAATYVVRSAFRVAFVAGLAGEELLAATEPVTSVVALVAALGIATLVGLRVVRATPAAARIIRPVGVAGVAAALSAAYDNAELAYGWTTGQPLNSLPEPWSEVFSWTVFAFVALVPIGFLVGTLRLRISHGAIGPLAIELDRRADPADLERALQHALGDPSLRLLVKDASTNSWRDAAQAVVEPPIESPGRAVTRLESGGDDMAALVHDDALREDPGLVRAATAVLRLAVENERLTADVRAQLEEVRASRARLVEAAQAERTRIERDLHDGAQQRLVSAAMMLQEALTDARHASPQASFVRRLDETGEELKSAIDELRELARGIHPAVLTEEGLGVAVAALARRSSVPVELDISLGEDRLAPAVEATGYYVIAEALTNVTRHSRARSATVRVKRLDGLVQVEIADDGQGGTDPARGTGLRGLADRLDAISGRLEIINPSSGGTILRAVIPCG